MVPVSVVHTPNCNLLSICRALEYCDAKVSVIENPEDLSQASHLVLPGVGAFGNCADYLKAAGFIEPIIEYAQSGKPILGICVGMQLLFESSSEFGQHPGLSLLPGNVVAIPRSNSVSSRHVIPHMGWYNLIPNQKSSLIHIDNCAENLAMYFVHSYYAETETQYVSAYYQSHGIEIPALVNKDNIYGCQFHPEKSGTNGIALLKAFLAL